MRITRTLTTLAVLLGLAGAAQADVLVGSDDCYTAAIGGRDSNDNQQRVHERLSELCGDDQSCWEEHGYLGQAIGLSQEYTGWRAEMCVLDEQHNQIEQQVTAVDASGEPLELTSCSASSQSWCDPTGAFGDCVIDLVGAQPFNWPETQPEAQCRQLEQAVETIGPSLAELMQPHNQVLQGNPHTEPGETFVDHGSPLHQELTVMGYTLDLGGQVNDVGDAAAQALQDSTDELAMLLLASVVVTPESIVDELGLDRSLIQPWPTTVSQPVPAHPSDADCERIRQMLAQKRVALAAIDCSALQAAYDAAMADLLAANLDLALADGALTDAEDAFDAADTAATDAQTALQDAADAITALVDKHIHHGGISTDGAGGAHTNKIGLSAGGVGFEIYFDGSQSSINTILWLFNTDAYKNARKDFRDAAKAARLAEEARADAMADWMDALLDYLDAADAADAAQARADAALAALNACLQRQRDAQQDVQDCEDKLDVCEGRQASDTTTAQGGARGAVAGAESELGETTGRGGDAGDAQDRIDEANDKLDESEQAESEGRHDDAQALAGEAESIANGVKDDLHDDNVFWQSHRPCNPEGATYDEVTGEWCTWGDAEPHLVPLGHTPTSYRALSITRKIIGAIGYAVTGSDPVNDTVDNIMNLTSIKDVRELYAFYYGNRAQEITTYICVSDGEHVYWSESGTRTEYSELGECGFALTSDLNDILDVSLAGDEDAVAAEVRDYVNRCRPTGCACEMPSGCN